MLSRRRVIPILRRRKAAATKPDVANDSRNAILSAASHLFAQEGYRTVGIDRVVVESGVAKMTLYRHFASKADLIVAVLKQRAQFFHDGLASCIAQCASPEARLKAVFRWHDDLYKSPSYKGGMFTHAAFEFKGEAGEIKNMAANQKTMLVRCLSTILKQQLSTPRAERLARVYVMLLDGAALTTQILGRKGAALEAWAAAKQLLAEAVQAEHEA